MVVTMQAGLIGEDPRVIAVVQKAQRYGLRPDVKSEVGGQTTITQVFMRDGDPKTRGVKACTVADHIFRPMEGVDTVQRLTPPKVSLTQNGTDYHRVKIGSVEIGTSLPCRLVMGPCTVDQHVESVLGALGDKGIRHLRGGCWKPRSSPHSFPGFGERAVLSLLKAARNLNAESVFIEVIESSHIDVVRYARNQAGYSGTIVLWVGARTVNTILLRTLGAQTEFPVMIKNGVDDLGISGLYDKAEWVLAGAKEWTGEGQLVVEESLKPGNSALILCLRGTRQTDNLSPWRFIPNHHWAELLRARCWAPVAIDPSHSAGTMENDLVIRNAEEALRHDPSLLMVEGGYPANGYDGFTGLCDQAQMVPIDRVDQLIGMVRQHNKARYGLDVF